MPRPVSKRKRNGAQHIGGKPGATELRARRAAEAYDLRCQHYTFREIGQRMQIDHAMAYRLVTEHYDNVIEPTTKEKAMQWRTMELDRLATIERKWTPVALADDVPAGATDVMSIELRLKAVDRVLRVQERRAKLLGLDAPIDVNVVARHLTLEEAAQRLAEADAGPDALP